MKRKKISSLALGILLSCAFVLSAVAHEGHHHPDETMKGPNVLIPERVAYSAINNNYLRDVKPIFKLKCMNCHSHAHEYPSYYKFPLVRRLIDSDVKESLEHIDMSKDFPFGGHGTPLEDLEAIAKVIDDGNMPPLSYRLMHSDSKLSNSEKLIIKNWVDASLKTLRSIPTNSNREKK